MTSAGFNNIGWSVSFNNWVYDGQFGFQVSTASGQAVGFYTSNASFNDGSSWSLFSFGPDTNTGVANFVATIYEGQDCVADVDDGSGFGIPDGGVTVDDLLYYLSIFNVGDLGRGRGRRQRDGRYRRRRDNRRSAVLPRAVQRRLLRRANRVYK